MSVTNPHFYCVSATNDVVHFQQVKAPLINYYIVRVTPQYYEVSAKIAGRQEREPYGTCIARKPSFEAALEYLGGRRAVKNATDFPITFAAPREAF